MDGVAPHGAGPGPEGTFRERDAIAAIPRDGGRTATGRDVVEWIREGVERGAGEVLLTSMDRDGTRDGYDLALTSAVAAAVNVPVIASGGAGSLDDFPAAVDAGADAVLAASVFHFGDLTIAAVKERLRATGHTVR